MIHVYCTRPSQGAMELVAALGADRLRRFDGMNFWRRNRKVEIKPGDIIVCWGNNLPEVDGVKVLNGEDPGNKLQSAMKLVEMSIPTVCISGAKQNELYVGRSNHHIGGNDLLTPPARPDFWVLKEDFVNEYRLHSFAGKSIRAGIKVPREDFPDPHKWIKSFEAGWKVRYDEFKSTKAMKKLAHNAIKALGLHFGAVDIAERANGDLIVLEVNRAPGIEGNSINRYCEAILQFAQGKPMEDVDEVDEGVKEQLKAAAKAAKDAIKQQVIEQVDEAARRRAARQERALALEAQRVRARERAQRLAQAPLRANPVQPPPNPAQVRRAVFNPPPAPRNPWQHEDFIWRNPAKKVGD